MLCDVKVENDDLVVSNGEVELIYDLQVVLQDLQHMVRESGILIQLIGERSANNRTLLERQLVLLAEEDERIVTASVALTTDDDGNYYISGSTYDYGDFAEVVSA